MERSMRKWAAELIAAEKKNPIPVLSFPAVQLMGISVKKIISDSELQARGMALVAERVRSAASVSLMDLSVEAECFGAEVRFSDEEVPTCIGAVVTDEDKADALEIPAVGTGRTGIYIEAIRKACGMISDRPVLAGVIGPFSLAARLMGVSEAMYNCYDEPDMVHTVMKKTTAFLIDYCCAYKQAGANGVVMAEPVTGLLSGALAQEFSHTYVKEIIDAVQDDRFAVIYHNCGGSVTSMADDVFALGAMGYHFGNAIKMEDVLPHAPAEVLVLGNIDPAEVLRNGTEDSVKAAVRTLKEKCRAWPNFILSSGCDVPPMTPWKNIDAFFAAAEE